MKCGSTVLFARQHGLTTSVPAWHNKQGEAAYEAKRRLESSAYRAESSTPQTA